MNNAKLWLVVKPTVGLPLFIGGVAVTSLAVHFAVLTNTTWIADFFSGGAANSKTASIQAPAIAGDKAATVNFTGSALPEIANGQPATIVMPDGRTAQIIFKAPTESESTVAQVTATDRTLE